MIGQRQVAAAFVTLGLAWGLAAPGLTAADDDKPAPASKEEKPLRPVKIGLARTLFRDTPEALVTAMMHPFGALMESQTGIPGVLIKGGSADNLGNLLATNKVQIGVFHGIEFAWARQKHPDLKPLMIAVNQQRHLRAIVVGSQDTTMTSFPDLKGTTLAFPCKSREHCHIFLQRHCQNCGQEPVQFFESVTNPPCAEDALDDVVDGVVQVALVDSVSLECYKRRKPGRSAQLKPILESEIFPAAVVAYQPGVLDEETLTRFREGLINANKSALGRQFITLWKLTAFEPVPSDYELTLTQIVKAYPHQAEKKPQPVEKNHQLAEKEAK
jgi:ABC-type phosphate/phosphonate transport system substrate-binding protein